MQFKPVPEPPDSIRAVEPILEAVPATAGAVDDCCQHLVAETGTGLEARSDAATWLVFLRALGLVIEESAGYRRVAATAESGRPIDPAALQQPFRDRVYGADALLEALERAAKPLSVAEVSNAVRDERPRFSDGHAADPHERIRRLLEWAVLLDLAARTADDDRYRSAGEIA